MPVFLLAEDFLERQRLAAGAKGCDSALMDCLSELADAWRQLAAASARKRHLQSLRDGVREEAAAVRSFEEAGAAALRTQVRGAPAGMLAFRSVCQLGCRLTGWPEHGAPAPYTAAAVNRPGARPTTRAPSAHRLPAKRPPLPTGTRAPTPPSSFPPPVLVLSLHLCLLQAAEFFDEVGGSGSPRAGGAGSAGGAGGSVQWSQRALGKLQRFHQLKDEGSIR